MVSIVRIIAAVLAAIFVMVCHELPKSIVYLITTKEKERKASIFHIVHYIDPIELLFCIAMGAGFSKSYKYKIASKQQAFAIGLTGFGSLLILFLSGLIVYEHAYTGIHVEKVLGNSNLLVQFAYCFIVMIVILSLGMFFVNLIPIAAFDMGLIVASISVIKYLEMVKKDSVMKLLLYVLLLLKTIPIMVIYIVNLI